MNQTNRHLKGNTIGLLEGILFVIGATVGSGIFLKPAVVLAGMGTTLGAFLMWGFGGLITLCAALSIAEIAAYLPLVGGLYAYLAELYGPKTAFLYGWVEAVISSPGAGAALAIAFATFSTYFVPMGETGIRVTAVLAIVIISVAQIISTRFGVWIQTISAIGKLIPLLAIIVFGLFRGAAGSGINTTLIGQGDGMAAALLGVLWTFDGWITVCALGGEMKNSVRNLPIAIIAGVLTVTAVYLAFNAAVFNVLSGEDAVTSNLIGVDAATILFGNGAMILVTAGMMLSAFGSLNAQIVCGTRVAFAMGERKQFPGASVLSRINPSFGTPANALLLQTVLAVIYALSGTFHQITDLVIFVIWIFFTLGIMGVFLLRQNLPYRSGRYRVPFYPVTPLLGTAGGLYLIYVTVRDSWESAVLGGGLMLIGLIVFHLCGKR